MSVSTIVCLLSFISFKVIRFTCFSTHPIYYGFVQSGRLVPLSLNGFSSRFSRREEDEGKQAQGQIRLRDLQVCLSITPPPSSPPLLAIGVVILDPIAKIKMGPFADGSIKELDVSSAMRRNQLA
jgi:hypothetical protein